jgi:hypothetical protein
MHYQCRSMEDFVARAKKRPELHATVALWLASDFHVVEDLRPAQRAATSPNYLYNLSRLNEIHQKRSIEMISGLSDSEETLLTLDQIGILTGTDKSSKHHGYLEFYDNLFKDIRNNPIKLLEIGVDKGASLYMWLNYFTNANCVGIDINQSSLNHVSKRLEIEIGDQSDSLFLNKIKKLHGPFDIIVDDGSHIWKHQMTSFVNLFEAVKPGGYYVIEDVQTSFDYHDSFQHFQSDSKFSTVDYMLRVAELTTARHVSAGDDTFLNTHIQNIECVIFHYGTVAIRKMKL